MYCILFSDRCTNDFEQILGITFKRSFPLAQCFSDLAPTYAHFRHVNKLIKRWVYRGVEFTELDIGQQLYEDAKSLVVRIRELEFYYFSERQKLAIFTHYSPNKC